MSAPAHPAHTVALVTLGCARNEVDSEELAGQLEAGGFLLVDDPADAETVVVNTCGFVEAAKKDSVDTLLAAADLKDPSAGGSGATKAVVAVGCLAERYGAELADSLPEADAVLGFDAYPDIADRLRSILAGDEQHAHTPSDRRKLLPITPTQRIDVDVVVPGHSFEVARGGNQEAGQRVGPGFDTALDDIGAGAPLSGPRAVRRRLDGGPMAPLKLASGCDRRCSFCAIPSFRGSFVSRRPADVLAEARWLGEQGVKELFLVSENSTSYGKDLGDIRLLETMLPELAAVEGVERVRVSYLQPAETRPGLVAAIAGTPGVADYFDLSFQHASPTVLRAMRRFGDPGSFADLLAEVRKHAPRAGVRSNFIVGFPGETEADFETLCDFVSEARLDAIGVFGYSDEDGTEAETYDGKLDADAVAERVQHLTALADELTAQRAEERIGERVVVLVEALEPDDGVTGPGTGQQTGHKTGQQTGHKTGQQTGHKAGGLAEGRAACQGPEVDGSTTLTGLAPGVRVGDMIEAVVVGTEGVDLVAEQVDEQSAGRV